MWEQKFYINKHVTNIFSCFLILIQSYFIPLLTFSVDIER